ncbi:hypothetical protein [Tenacibaculum caenipelagi]|uniref:Thioredoxin domain-containing protein n=1 Tax=Tenacibaculum caenipelagi TaxID=1325435 RepID=A0A4R6TD98_9FLAO|nr:hypothetical protein [Tenacibaculum caenipelagi]TDQ25794.1 hypothetical protein DFQ07_2225 [Tenacibaculum caenipelagi]
MVKYFIPLILIVFIGCKESNTPKSTYFGGKIINPKCNFVTLSDSYNFNDTIPLEKNNTFLGHYDNLKEGLYVFEHGPEHQYVYIQPSDSILIRLNTWDFDESLVFSGNNAERNNLLIESFLQYEQDEKNIAKYFHLPQNKFVHKIDSLQNIKKEIFNRYKENNDDASEKFLSILDIALQYPLYTNLEKYAIKNATQDEPEVLADSYYDYRKKAHIDKDSLMFFGAYYRFVIEKIYNDVYQKNCLNKSDNFTVDLFHSIDKNIASEEIKNKMLYNAVISHFFKEPNHKKKDETFFTFFKLNTNNKQKKAVQRIINDLKLLNTGEKLPSFNLIASDGEFVDVQNISKGKNTVILFKNYKYASDDWVSSRFNFLVKNNPDVNFILVNLCDSSKRYTKNVDIKYQYTLPKGSSTCNYSSSKFSRLVLVDKGGIIRNGYTSLSALNINQEINNLQKNK